jgi:hypothetical protein
MIQFVKAIAAFTVLILIYSCSTTGNCSTAGGYQINFSTGGGFTGIENGITINCNGRVLFWERRANSPSIVKDSLILQPEQLKRLDELMQNPDLLTYSHTFNGNYTSTLTITKENISNTISYNPSEEPSDFPSVIRDIILEIKNIKK